MKLSNIKLPCSFCRKICKLCNQSVTVVKCENCNVLYEIPKSYNNYILSYYILSTNETFDFDKNGFLYGIHNQFIVNGKIPKYCLIKYGLSDFSLYKISAFNSLVNSLEFSSLRFKLLSKNSQILSQITPFNFDKKLKTILTFM
jgi:hypothetical protein